MTFSLVVSHIAFPNVKTSINVEVELNMKGLGNKIK